MKKTPRKYSLVDLERMEMEEAEIPWVFPDEVQGLENPKRIRATNLETYYMPIHETLEAEEMVDETLAFYYMSCFSRRMRRGYNSSDLLLLIENVVFLITEYYTSFASTLIGDMIRAYVNKQNVHSILDILRRAWSEADEHAKRLLKPFIFDIFDYWQKNLGDYADAMTEDEIAFLDMLYDIEPEDVSFFLKREDESE